MSDTGGVLVVIGALIAFLMGPILIAMTLDGISAAWGMWRDLFHSGEKR